MEPSIRETHRDLVMNTHVYDMEVYKNLMNILTLYTAHFLNPADKEVATHYLRVCKKIHDLFPLCRRHNIKFLRYFLKVCKWTYENQPTDLYYNWFADTLETTECKWLPNNSGYTAVKKLGKNLSVVYTAKTNNPEMGWVEDGIRELEKQSYLNIGRWINKIEGPEESQNENREDSVSDIDLPQWQDSENNQYEECANPCGQSTNGAENLASNDNDLATSDAYQACMNSPEGTEEACQNQSQAQ